jgi:esterase/lipase
VSDVRAKALRFIFCASVLFGCSLAMGQNGKTQEPVRQASPTSRLPAAAPVGIVLMHGKKGAPAYLDQVKTVLEDHGYLVSTPEMCWSANRMYDRIYADCLTEIDAAVAGLKQRGAKSIVIAGHSLGGGAAIAYGANHDDLVGVIGIAAGDAFWGPPSLLPDIARAKSLVDKGEGDTRREFEDVSTVGSKPMRTTAAHFLSFVAQSPSQLMPENAARLRVPLLLIAGTRDMVSLQYETRTYDKVRNHALNRFVQVEADHNGTLRVGMKDVLDWLASLVRQDPERR